MKHQKKKYIFFTNCAHKMLKLNGNDRVLLDFICERMASDNRITINIDFKKSYINFLEIVSSKKTRLSVSQVNTSLKKLILLDLLIKERKGLYILSPKHFTKTTLKQNRVHFKNTQEFLERKTKDKTLLNIPRN